MKAFPMTNSFLLNFAFYSMIGRKHCGKRRKCQLQVFSFFPTIFSIFTGLLKATNVWKKVNPFPNKPWVLCVCNRRVLKTLWEKEKLLVTSNFSFSHNVFYRFGKLSGILIKLYIVICKLFQFGRV